MEITYFETALEYATETNVRDIAANVRTMLDNNCGLKEIEVTNDEFDSIINLTNSTPNVASIFNFIRVYDLNDNSVDIQTRKPKNQ